MDKKIIIIGIVGVIGIITIASVVVYQFLQQQDDRQKAINTINAAEDRAKQYEICLQQNRHTIETMKKADALINAHNEDFYQKAISEGHQVEPPIMEAGPYPCDDLK